MSRLLICGYFGFGNGGDEAILTAMLEELRQQVAEAEPVVVSGAPAQTSASHGVEAVQWNDLAAVVAAVRSCDAVVIGGGGLLHDYCPFEAKLVLTSRYGGIAFQGTVALLASLLGKRLMVYAIGVGPLVSHEARQQTRALLEQAAVVTVRDPESAALLQSLDVAGTIEVTADPVHGLTPVPEAQVRLLLEQAAVPSPAGPLVGVALRPWHDGISPQRLAQEVAAALDSFAEQHQASVLLLPMQRSEDESQDDRSVAAMVRSAMRLADRVYLVERRCTPGELAGLLAACDLVVAMRYHAVLLAATAGRPLVGLIYDGKVRSLLRQLGCQEAGLELPGLRRETVRRAMERPWQDRENEGQRLAAVSRELRDRSRRNPQLLHNLLRRRRAPRPPLSAASKGILGELAVTLALHHDATYRSLVAAIEHLQQERHELAAGANRQATAEQQALLARLATLQAENRVQARELATARQRQLEQQLQERDRRLCSLDQERAELQTGLLRLEAQHSEALGRLAATEQRCTGLVQHQGTLAAYAHEISRQLVRLRSGKAYQLAKLIGGLRWLPPAAWLRLPWRLLRRLGNSQVALGLPELPPVVAIGDTVEQLSNLLGDNGRAAAQPVPEPATTADPLGGLVAASQPLVSVLLPVFNHADLLPQAVASIQAQTYQHWQLLILDDGSEDGINQVFAELAGDPRIELYQQENQRLPNALTHLHELARGELLTWTSADNLLAPTMLERLVAAISEDPATVMVYGDGALIDDQGQPFRGDGYRDHNRDPERPEVLRLARHIGALGEEADNFINACFLYRAWAARAIGAYGPDLNCLEDYDFFLRLRRLGRCRHVANHEPLYLYRVHRRTMSQQVIDSEWQAHLARCDLLIELDRRRQAWAEQRWQVLLSAQLGEAARQRLAGLLRGLPVDIHDANTGSGRAPWAAKDLLLLTAEQELPAAGIVVRCLADSYQVILCHDGSQRTVGTVPIGERISMLATKARHQRNPELYVELRDNGAGDRPCLGSHLAFAEVDADAAIALIKGHPELFFVLIDHPDRPDTGCGNHIAAACANCIYVGPRPYGGQYTCYADLAAIICLPLQDGAHRALDQSSHLAVATGRWLLYPAGSAPLATLPWAMPYQSGDPLPAVWRLPRATDLVRQEVLDRWLDWGGERSCLERALRLATGAAQDLAVSRPDFGQLAPPGPPARAWIDTEITPCDGWIGLWVDHLDRGGLEEVVAMLARELHSMGQEVRVLCSLNGGLVADQTRSNGIPCEVFLGDDERFAAYLQDSRPALLSSHFTWQLLEVPDRLGIPVVETIHNTYAFFDAEGWQHERWRCQGWRHAIAVSELARDYYLRWNRSLTADKVTVISNAADLARTRGRERQLTRRMLGLGQDTCLFLNLASFEARKNQVGLLTAFDQVWRSVGDQVALLLAGNTTSVPYHQRVLEHLAQLPSRQAVMLSEYQQDVGSLLLAADALVLPSYYEGWSIVGTEALYAGLPLIHTDCGSGRTLCDEGRGLLVPNPGGDNFALDATRVEAAACSPAPPNTADLVHAMLSISNNLAAWRQRRPQIRTGALHRFSLQRMARSYLEVFHRVLAQSAR